MTTTASPLPNRVAFLDERAKARAVAAVRVFEAHTSAELVITVRKQVRSYTESDMIVGALFAFAALMVLLFHPIEFAVYWMPIDVIVAFALGFVLSRTLPPVQKIFVRSSKRREAVNIAAKAAFYDLGITRTTGRTGVLVFVALAEGMVALVTDTGVTAEANQAANDTKAALEAALAHSDMRTFAETLEKLGSAFGATMAHADDDVNELPDEIA
jgi:putative membrane protein